MNSLLKRANTYVQRVDEGNSVNKNNSNNINENSSNSNNNNNNNNKTTNNNSNKFDPLLYGNANNE